MLHQDAPNTHRLCQHASDPDDGDWLHTIEWNRGDAWNLRRIIDAAFGFSEKPT